MSKPAATTTIDLTNETRDRYGIRAWIARRVKDGGVTFVAMVEFGGAVEEAGSAFTSLDDTYGIGQARQYAEEQLNDRCAELVVFAAARAEGALALPDATPVDAEAEAEQAGQQSPPVAQAPRCPACETIGYIGYGRCCLCGFVLAIDPGSSEGDRTAIVIIDAPAIAAAPLVVVADFLTCCDGTGLVAGPDGDVYDCPACGAPPEAGGQCNPLPANACRDCGATCGANMLDTYYACCDLQLCRDCRDRRGGFGACNCPNETTTSRHPEREITPGPPLYCHTCGEVLVVRGAQSWCPACDTYSPTTTNTPPALMSDEEIHQAHLAGLLDRECQFLALSLTCPARDEARYNELAAEARREYNAIKHAQPYQIAKLNREREEASRVRLPFHERAAA